MIAYGVFLFVFRSKEKRLLYKAGKYIIQITKPSAEAGGFLQFGYQLQDFQTGVFTYNKNVLRGGGQIWYYIKNKLYR